MLLKRGSILMEFVLVLPIYLLLLGALFLIGDMGLNAIRIALGGRILAMDSLDKAGFSLTPFLSRQMRDEASKASFSSRTYRADEDFDGSWSWQAAGRMYFTYKLPSYGGGLISYPYLHYGDVTSGSGILETLVGGKTVTFHSKDISLGARTRLYNYYTLKRTDLARDPQAYRNWDSHGDTSISLLMDSSSGDKYWYRCVYKEEYADPKPESLDMSSQTGRDGLPDQPSGRKEYTRYPMFVTWSQ